MMGKIKEIVSDRASSSLEWGRVGKSNHGDVPYWPKEKIKMKQKISDIQACDVFPYSGKKCLGSTNSGDLAGVFIHNFLKALRANYRWRSIYVLFSIVYRSPKGVPFIPNPRSTPEFLCQLLREYTPTLFLFAKSHFVLHHFTQHDI